MLPPFDYQDTMLSSFYFSIKKKIKKNKEEILPFHSSILQNVIFTIRFTVLFQKENKRHLSKGKFNIEKILFSVLY